MTWWRAWEFVAGGMIAALAGAVAGRPGAARLGALAGWGGLALVALSVSFVGLGWLGVEHGLLGRIIGYPGAAAALPVAGAVLVIWGGLMAPRSAAALLLSLGPIVYLGQISYALYLWHWPLIVFGHFLPVQTAASTVNLIAVAAAVALAVLTRYAIELPILAWRKRVKLGSDRLLPVRIFLAGVAGCIALVAVSGGVVALAYRNAGNSPMLAGVKASEVHPAGPCASEEADIQSMCLDGLGAAGIMVGDSHAFANMPRVTFEAEQQGLGILQLTMPGCDTLLVMLEPEKAANDTFCAPLVQKLARFMPRLGDAIGFAIVDGYWNARFRLTNHDPAEAAARLRAGFGRLMKTVSGEGERRVLVIGPVPSFWRSDPFNCLALAAALGLPDDRCGVPRAVEDDWRRDTVAIMREIVATYPNARFIDPIDLFCDERLCMPVKDGTLAFFDDNHVNAYGSRLIFDTFRADFDWAFKG